MATGDPALGPLMHQPRVRFKHEIPNPYLIVTTWANMLRRLYNEAPTPATALFITTIMFVQAATTERLRKEIAEHDGKHVVGTSLKEWNIAYAKYRSRLNHYLAVVTEIRAGERPTSDLHSEWFLPIFEGDYSEIVGMSKAEYDKTGGKVLGEPFFAPPKNWSPDAYVGATLYNQVAQAEDLLSPFDFVNRIIGWGRAAERQLSRSAPGEKATWNDRFSGWVEDVRAAAEKYWPTVKKYGEIALYGALGLIALVGGAAIYAGRHKAMKLLVKQTPAIGAA